MLSHGFENRASYVGVLTLVLMVVVAASHAMTTRASSETLYKVTDEDGNVTFTDAPPSGEGYLVEPHSLPTGNSAIPPTTQVRQFDNGLTPQDAPSRYQTAITMPATGATIPMGPGDFIVGASINPPLSPAETLLLEVDGRPAAAPQQHSTWQLKNIFRGAHQLRILRRDASGDTVHQSEITAVFVMRPSVIP